MNMTRSYVRIVSVVLFSLFAVIGLAAKVGAGSLAGDPLPTPTPPAPDIYAPKSGIPEGYTLIEGDILVRTSELQALGPDGVWNTQFWPNGVVPFDFDGNVNAANQQHALNAMRFWEAVANVDFRVRNGEADFIHIQDATGNQSAVGRQGGQQDVDIFNWDWEFIIAHELGHALGMWHEQSRPDRNTYITVNTANIARADQHNFNISSGADVYPHDYGIVAPAVSLPNGNFEQRPNNAWTETSSTSAVLISPGSAFSGLIAPHSGNWAARLGGANNETSDLSITIPAGFPPGTDVVLSLFYFISSSDTCGFDRGEIIFDSEVIDIDNLIRNQWDLCALHNTGGWTELIVPVSVFRFGQDFTIHFRVTTDGSAISTLLIDDVALRSAIRVHDFDSVMQYGQCAFSTTANCPAGGGQTITVLAPNQAWQNWIGQRVRLSDLDQLTMSFLYPAADWRFVDRMHTGAQSGTFLQPFQAFTIGMSSTPNGGTLWVQPGAYAAVGTYNRPMTIRAPLGSVTLGP